MFFSYNETSGLLCPFTKFNSIFGDFYIFISLRELLNSWAIFLRLRELLAFWPNHEVSEERIDLNSYYLVPEEPIVYLPLY
jgi:hypothetical protein